MRALLQRGANIDAKNQGEYYDCGYTALHVAAERGHEQIVSILLQEERTQTQRASTTLKGYRKVLLNEGVDAIARFNGGRTALSVALNKGHYSVAHLLQTFCLHSTARDRNIAPAGEALAAGVDVNGTWNEQSASFRAVSSDQEAMVRFLLGNQANANTGVCTRPISIECGIRSGQYTDVKLLLCNGAETGVVNREGCTPSAIAAMSGHEDIVLRAKLLG